MRVLLPRPLAFALFGSLFVGALSLAVLGCSPTPQDNRYTCRTTSECPAGFRCRVGMCRNVDDGFCRLDIDCDDGEVCTDDICDDGVCSNEALAESAYCTDDLFCNGAEECRSGRCQNLGVPPCSECVEGTGCGSCGSVGEACCDAGGGFPQICFGGLCNPSGVCEACGGPGEQCCEGGFCGEGYTCDGLTCVACGTENGPCCMGAIGLPEGGAPFTPCQVGLECRGDNQCLPCGGIDQPCCLATGCNEVGWCSAPMGAGTCQTSSCGEACTDVSICSDTDGDGAGACEACGTAGRPCCTGQACLDGVSFCIFGWCEAGMTF